MNSPMMDSPMANGHGQAFYFDEETYHDSPGLVIRSEGYNGQEITV